MRILHTESSKGWGGQENRTLNELITMRDRGHTLAVVSRPGARILDRAKEAGFETFVVDMRGAIDLPAIIREMLVARTSERQGRLIDQDAGASMEKKKAEGYF